MKHLVSTTVLILALTAGFSACRKKGPVEKAGEKLDNAAEEIREAVDPQGPAEKAGEKVDKALGN